MKSSHKFTFAFDPNLLIHDLDLINTAWVNHFNTSLYEGQWKGIVLRAPDNSSHTLAANNENKYFRDTALLERTTYFQKVLSQFDCTKTTVRLLKLAPGSVVKLHRDPDLSFWEGLVRIHVPILTNNQVKFILGGKLLEMKPGECWFGEFTLPHSVTNHGKTERIHLVFDLKINDWLHELFINEGIIRPDEKKPDTLSKFSQSELSNMIQTLVRMHSDTSLGIAREICNEHGYNIEDFNLREALSHKEERDYPHQ